MCTCVSAPEAINYIHAILNLYIKLSKLAVSKCNETILSITRFAQVSYVSLILSHKLLCTKQINLWHFQVELRENLEILMVDSHRLMVGPVSHCNYATAPNIQNMVASYNNSYD